MLILSKDILGKKDILRNVLNFMTNLLIPAALTKKLTGPKFFSISSKVL